MKTRTGYALLVCGVALAGAAYALAASDPQPDAEKNAAPRWEHLALRHGGTDVQNDRGLAGRIIQLGDRGWELVDVSTAIKDGTTLKTIFYFKRPK